jgi:hypothetical protein
LAKQTLRFISAAMASVSAALGTRMTPPSTRRLAAQPAEGERRFAGRDSDSQSRTQERRWSFPRKFKTM